VTVRRVRDNIVGWCSAEIWRRLGEQHLATANSSRSAEALVLFRRAVNVAGHQGAVGWELRAAYSQCVLLIGTPDEGVARRQLRGIYDRFSEGLDTVDLRSARALLEG